MNQRQVTAGVVAAGLAVRADYTSDDMLRPASREMAPTYSARPTLAPAPRGPLGFRFSSLHEAPRLTFTNSSFDRRSVAYSIRQHRQRVIDNRRNIIRRGLFDTWGSGPSILTAVIDPTRVSVTTRGGVTMTYSVLTMGNVAEEPDMAEFDNWGTTYNDEGLGTPAIPNVNFGYSFYEDHQLQLVDVTPAEEPLPLLNDF